MSHFLCGIILSNRVSNSINFFLHSSFEEIEELEIACKMVGFLAFNSLAPKTKNLVVAGGLTAFVFGVYYYTMRAVGGTDELQVAIDKFEAEKRKAETQEGLASKT